ncbi:hypothetical protein WH285_12205 [Acinetobacter johnsonii]|uniref:hypothetical protein n=1 Tax=Acinetobacter johnsonii TaxID=40214 RepID=UPI0030ABE51B
MTFEAFLDIFSSSVVQTIIAVILIALVSSRILTFLNNSSKKDKDSAFPSFYVKELKDIVLKVEELERSIEEDKLGKVDFTIEDKNLILKNIEDKLNQESNEEYLERLELNIKKTVFEEIFNGQIERSIERLREEKASSFRRGNFNLMIGVMISSVGGYIAYTFIQKLPTADNTVQLFSYTLPRLSFFMLMILLAFFFLNLYRKSMEDIKYYQNEITNLEVKYLSLQMAKSMNNHKLISSILEQLVKTERNFVLEKDQSTIELEKERISSNNANNTLQAVKDIFQSKK